MKKLTSVVSKLLIYLGLGITASHTMEIPKDIVNKEMRKDYDTVKAEGDSLREIASYLPIHDLCSMELVCINYATALKNAPQYEALIYDHNDEDGWKGLSKDQPTAKNKFLILKDNNYKFLFHLVELWRNYFPFYDEIYQRFNLKRTHYWDKVLTKSQNIKMSSVYNSINNIISSGFTKMPPTYHYESLLGSVLMDNSMWSQSREILRGICSSNDLNCLQTTKMDASLELVLGNYLLISSHKNYILLRKGFINVINSKYTKPESRATALFRIAEIDSLGQGIPYSDYQAARYEFTALLDNNAAYPPVKASALFRLAEMDNLGQGISNPDYETAHGRFKALLNNNAATLYHARS